MEGFIVITRWVSARGGTYIRSRPLPPLPSSSLKLTQPPTWLLLLLSFSAVPGVIRFTFFSKPRIFQDGKDFYVYVHPTACHPRSFVPNCQSDLKYPQTSRVHKRVF